MKEVCIAFAATQVKTSFLIISLSKQIYSVIMLIKPGNPLCTWLGLLRHRTFEFVPSQ